MNVLDLVIFHKQLQVSSVEFGVTGLLGLMWIGLSDVHVIPVAVSERRCNLLLMNETKSVHRLLTICNRRQFLNLTGTKLTAAPPHVVRISYGFGFEDLCEIIVSAASQHEKSLASLLNETPLRRHLFTLCCVTWRCVIKCLPPSKLGGSPARQRWILCQARWRLAFSYTRPLYRRANRALSRRSVGRSRGHSHDYNH